MNAKKIRSFCRPIRVLAGLALINFCPLCKITGQGFHARMQIIGLKAL